MIFDRLIFLTRKRFDRDKIELESVKEKSINRSDPSVLCLIGSKVGADVFQASLFCKLVTNLSRPEIHLKILKATATMLGSLGYGKKMYVTSFEI